MRDKQNIAEYNTFYEKKKLQGIKNYITKINSFP